MINNMTDDKDLIIFMDYMSNAIPNLISILCIVGIIIAVGLAIAKIISRISGIGENYSETEEPIKVKRVKPHKQTYLEYLKERVEAEKILSS